MKINELKAEVVRSGLTLEELADRMGLARSTLWKRFANPENFSLSEIKEAAKILELDGNRVLDIFFADKVS